MQKRRLLRLYGSARCLPAPLRRLVLPALLACTRCVYGRLVCDTARWIADYRRTGYDVVTVVGVDGSPSCGVGRSLDIPAAVDRLARVDRRTVTSEAVNDVLRDTLVPGPGLFTESLRRRLRRRRIAVPFLAHDLPGELAGEPSPAVAELRRLTARR